jgi:hypothetical protein
MVGFGFSYSNNGGELGWGFVGVAVLLAIVGTFLLAFVNTLLDKREMAKHHVLCSFKDWKFSECPSHYCQEKDLTNLAG